MPPPVVAMPYVLPFKVMLQAPPLLQAGGPVNLAVEFPHAPSADEIDEVSALLPLFTFLADAGALGGDTIAPWQSTVEDEERTAVSGKRVEWLLHGCRLDERAAVVLAH